MLLIRTVDYERLQILVDQLNEQYNGHCEFVLDNERLMPYLNRSKNVIEFSNRLDTILALFTAYKYEPEQLHKTLFLYLLANKHVETGNWYNADIVLEELQTLLRRKFIEFLNFPSIPDDIVFYLDYQAEAMLAHEYGHYIFSMNEKYLIETKQMIKDLFMPTQKGIDGFFRRLIANRLFRDKHLMEELSCDWFAMTVMSERFKSNNDIKFDVKEVSRQILRLFISMSYLDVILPTTPFIRSFFGRARAAIVGVCLNREWDEMTPSPFFEEVRESGQRNHAAKKQLFHKLKYYRMRKDSSYIATKKEREKILEDMRAVELNIFNVFRDSLNATDFSIWADYSFPDIFRSC